MPLLSQDEFKDRVRARNPHFEVLSEYKGMRKKILRRCTQCGEERYVLAHHLLEGHGCPRCTAQERGKSYRKSHEEFVSQIASINPNIIILSEYQTNLSRIQCKCKIDGFLWETQAHVLLGGHGCPVCGRANNELASKPRMTHDEYVAAVSKRFPNIKVLTEYKATTKRVTYMCTCCNYTWNAIASTILHAKSESGCPRCAKVARVSEPEFLERLRQSTSYVDYVSGYTTMTSHALFRCAKCGHEWSALPPNILKGRGCPKCKLSRGAKSISKYLREHNVLYEAEYRFDDCVDERQLPFDFYLPELNTVIEYDGEQHFGPVRFGQYTEDIAIAKFEQAQKHDEIKNKYCETHNINLIRIPYTDFDEIPNILDKLIS